LPSPFLRPNCSLSDVFSFFSPPYQSNFMGLAASLKLARMMRIRSRTAASSSALATNDKDDDDDEMARKLKPHLCSADEGAIQAPRQHDAMVAAAGKDEAAPPSNDHGGPPPPPSRRPAD
jgi:hypothetical protein